MATYGFPPPGAVAFTGFSPTLGVGDAATPATSGQVQFNGLTQYDGALSRLLFQGPNRIVRRLLIAMIGVAPGATATENRTRVTATPALGSITTNGGLLPIETVALINRATTATDTTNLNAMITRTPAPTYIADAGGNGGGGKLGF